MKEDDENQSHSKQHQGREWFSTVDTIWQPFSAQFCGNQVVVVLHKNFIFI